MHYHWLFLELLGTNARENARKCRDGQLWHGHRACLAAIAALKRSQLPFNSGCGEQRVSVDTGIVHHELLFVGPATFEEAVSHAKEKAPERSVERIHVKHARQANKPDTKAKPVSKAKSKLAKTISGAKSKKRTSVKKKIAA